MMVVAALSLTVVAVAVAKSSSITITTYPNTSREYQIKVTGYASKPARVTVLTEATGCPATPAGASPQVTASVDHSYKFVRYALTNQTKICVYLVAKHGGALLAHKSATYHG
jgi:hypothetical protein